MYIGNFCIGEKYVFSCCKFEIRRCRTLDTFRRFYFLKLFESGGFSIGSGIRAIVVLEW